MKIIQVDSLNLKNLTSYSIDKASKKCAGQTSKRRKTIRWQDDQRTRVEIKTPPHCSLPGHDCLRQRYQSGSGRRARGTTVHCKDKGRGTEQSMGRPRDWVVTSLSTGLPHAFTDKTACVLTGNKPQVVSVSLKFVVSHIRHFKRPR